MNRKPTTPELDAAAEPLHRLLELLPRLRVVLLHGGDAQAGWRRFRRQYPGYRPELVIVSSYHTSRQTFWHPDPVAREGRLEKLRADLRSVVALLAEDDKIDSRL